MNLLQVTLNGGLCNKLFCLFSACDIAINKQIQLLEPNFGWKRKILFSDIYDIDFFNDMMKKHNNGKDIMIPYNERNKYKIIKNSINLWNYSEKIITKQRQDNQISRNCMMIKVLNSLKLNKSNNDVSQKFGDIENKNAIHIRTESDWKNYAKKWDKNRGIYFLGQDKLISRYSENFDEDVFFTTGEQQFKIKEKFSKKDINSEFFFD